MFFVPLKIVVKLEASELEPAFEIGLPRKKMEIEHRFPHADVSFVVEVEGVDGIDNLLSKGVPPRWHRTYVQERARQESRLEILPEASGVPA